MTGDSQADQRSLIGAARPGVAVRCGGSRSHCCYFVAGSRSPRSAVGCDHRQQLPGDFEYTHTRKFVRLWAGYGGFAITILSDPPGSIPYLSYLEG